MCQHNIYISLTCQLFFLQHHYYTLHSKSSQCFLMSSLENSTSKGTRTSKLDSHCERVRNGSSQQDHPLHGPDFLCKPPVRSISQIWALKINSGDLAPHLEAFIETRTQMKTFRQMQHQAPSSALGRLPKELLYQIEGHLKRIVQIQSDDRWQTFQNCGKNCTPKKHLPEKTCRQYSKLKANLTLSPPYSNFVVDKASTEEKFKQMNLLWKRRHYETQSRIKAAWKRLEDSKMVSSPPSFGILLVNLSLLHFLAFRFSTRIWHSYSTPMHSPL